MPISLSDLPSELISLIYSYAQPPIIEDMIEEMDLEELDETEELIKKTRQRYHKVIVKSDKYKDDEDILLNVTLKTDINYVVSKDIFERITNGAEFKATEKGLKIKDKGESSYTSVNVKHLGSSSEYKATEKSDYLWYASYMKNKMIYYDYITENWLITSPEVVIDPHGNIIEDSDSDSDFEPVTQVSYNSDDSDSDEDIPH